MQPRLIRISLSALTGFILAVSAPPSLAAGDPAAGRAKAGMCTTCHGPLGIAQMPATPNLAAQPAMYLSAQLKAFRSGARTHQVMNVIAKGLNDSDIDNLSAWFASIRISVVAP